MSLPYWQQCQEAEFFNWKCLICHIIAQSHMHLEDQFIGQYGPYTDLDNQKWIKCSKCMSPFHITCLVGEKEIPVGPYVCSFICCQH